MKTAEIETAIEAALEKVGLTEYRKRKLSDLSGGQRQRLVIAGVLATNPEILVFDEPTSALDPEGTHEFYELVHELNVKYGHTLIVNEQSLEAVVPYANRLVLLEEGRVLCDSDLETTLRYMYEHNVCKSAVPQIFACQLDFEKAGFKPPHTWLTADAAVEDLQNIG